MTEATHFLFSILASRRLHENAIVCIKMQSRRRDHAAKRLSLKNGFKKSLVRVLDFSKHETLRKVHRYMHKHRALSGQDYPGASQMAFDPGELAQDLQSMLYSEVPDMLNASAQDALTAVGLNLPYQMPNQDVLDYIASRENLLSGVSDEVYQQIKDELSAGLAAGESIPELSDRISSAFDDISSGRADVIADTEATAAYNYASYTASVDNGVAYKQWLHGASRVPRPDHLEINGLVVPIDQPYPVGDPQLMYPHDPDGSPEDVINCSCISIPAGGGTGEEQQQEEE